MQRVADTSSTMAMLVIKADFAMTGALSTEPGVVQTAGFQGKLLMPSVSSGSSLPATERCGGSGVLSEAIYAAEYCGQIASLAIGLPGGSTTTTGQSSSSTESIFDDNWLDPRPRRRSIVDVG
jgi:hypothetical protein